MLVVTSSFIFCCGGNLWGLILVVRYCCENLKVIKLKGSLWVIIAIGL